MSFRRANGDINDQDPNQPRNHTKKLSKEHYIELAAFCDSIYDRGKTKTFFILPAISSSVMEQTMFRGSVLFEGGFSRFEVRF